MSSANGTDGVAETAGIAGVYSSLPDEFAGYFKGLVGQIEIGLPKQGSRVLLLSSSSAGEGTTEVTIGLGLTLALAMGRKTAVVDCNSQHPEMHIRFRTPEAGLGNYLAGEITLDRALANTVVPNMYVMPVGTHPFSLVGAAKDELESLIGELRNKFDYVLIDTAPVGTYPDCAVLCDKVDAVILIVKHGSTRREVARRTKEIVVRAGGRILGVVLNRRNYPIPEFIYKRL
ncbi:MAG TPA: CpsD/CapB family tyrosine-protein kinase [bacterium]|nr:CpsD/CapB family tyrosine-protein kinase [bacterium]